MREALRHWLGLMVLVVASTALLVASCSAGSGAGGTGSGDSGSGGTLFGDAGVNDIVDLSFNPSSATLVVDGTSPESASFELVATFGSGDSLVVAAESLEFDRPDLAALDPGPPAVLTAVGDYAGTGELHGITAVASGHWRLASPPAIRPPAAPASSAAPASASMACVAIPTTTPARAWVRAA